MRTLIVQFFKIPIQLSTRLISADATSCTWSHRLPPLSSDFPISFMQSSANTEKSKGGKDRRYLLRLSDECEPVSAKTMKLPFM